VITTFQKIKFSCKELVGEWELAFDDGFQKFMVCAVKVVKNPRVEELKFKKRHLYLGFFLAFDRLSLHIVE
jgi:hypothetical protein